MANTTETKILTSAGKALLAQVNAEELPFKLDKLIFANIPEPIGFPQPDDGVPTEYVVFEKHVEQRGRLSPDTVIYSTTLTSKEGPFEFNWTGGYSSEHGVLVTIDHHKRTPKTADEPGVAGNTMVRSITLEYKDIAEITNITVDASSWQYNATPRMKKMDDDVAQAIIDQNGKDWFIDDGFLVTPQASAFNIKAGAGYVSGNRVTLEFDRNVQVPNKPSFIYVDAHREGTPTGEQVTLFDFVITAEEKDDYTDANEVKHFVCKIAQVLGDGSVSDLRPEGESASRDYVDDSSLKVNELVTNEKVYPKNPKRHAKIGDSIPVDTTSVIIKKDNVLSQLVLEKPVFEAGTLETIGNGYLVINGIKYVALPVNNFDVEADIDLDDSIKITRTGRFHGLFLKLFGHDKSTVLVGGEQQKATSGFVVSGFKLKGDDTQPTNDHAVMTVSSVDGAILTEHEVEGGYNSFSLEYGEANIDGDRRSINSIVASFIARGSYMGFEMFANAYCAVAGLVASRAGRTRGTQHGMRITGYGKNHLNQGHDLRNRGNNYSGFASHNYTNGVSQQTGAYNNNVNFTATDGENGLHFTENTTLDDAISRSNNYTFAIGGMKHGSYLYDPLCSSFRGTIDEGKTYGWYTRKGARRAESNSYDLTVSNSNGLEFADSHSRIYVTAKELISGCIISGNWNIVDIVIDENNFNQESQNLALRISGSNNIVRVIVTNAKQPFSEVVVSGHDNDLTLSLDTSGTNGKVALLGNNNTLRGKCNIGTVTGYGNDYSAVSGFYCQGKASVSFTNGRGFINVLMKTSAYVLSIEPYLLNEPRILYFKVVSSSASQIVIDAYDKDGNAISGDFSIYYQGRAYQ